MSSTRKSAIAVAAFAAVHAFVWTALPTLLYRNLPLDLIEALTYGREWQLGYDKLPPLPLRVGCQDRRPGLVIKRSCRTT